MKIRMVALLNAPQSITNLNIMILLPLIAKLNHGIVCHSVWDVIFTVNTNLPDVKLLTITKCK